MTQSGPLAGRKVGAALNAVAGRDAMQNYLRSQLSVVVLAGERFNWALAEP